MNREVSQSGIHTQVNGHLTHLNGYLANFQMYRLGKISIYDRVYSKSYYKYHRFAENNNLPRVRIVKVYRQSQ